MIDIRNNYRKLLSKTFIFSAISNHAVWSAGAGYVKKKLGIYKFIRFLILFCALPCMFPNNKIWVWHIFDAFKSKFNFVFFVRVPVLFWHNFSIHILITVELLSFSSRLTQKENGWFRYWFVNMPYGMEVFSSTGTSTGIPYIFLMLAISLVSLSYLSIIMVCYTCII